MCESILAMTVDALQMILVNEHSIDTRLFVFDETLKESIYYFLINL